MDNAKKDILESICDEIIGFKKKGRNDLMCMKTKELGGKTMGFKTLASKTLKGI
jgi:hypothetical protein